MDLRGRCVAVWVQHLKASLQSRQADYAQAAAELKVALTRLVERLAADQISRALDAERVPEDTVKDVCEWLIRTKQWRDLSLVASMVEAFIEARDQLNAEEAGAIHAPFGEPEYFTTSGDDRVLRIAAEPELQDRLLRWHASFSVVKNVVLPGEQGFGFAVLSFDGQAPYFTFQVPGFAEIVVKPERNEWIWRGDGAFADVISAIKSFLDHVGAPP